MNRETFCQTLKQISIYSLTNGELKILAAFAYGSVTVEEIEADYPIRSTRIYNILKTLERKDLIVNTKELRNRFYVYDLNESLFNIF